MIEWEMKKIKNYWNEELVFWKIDIFGKFLFKLNEKIIR